MNTTLTIKIPKKLRDDSKRTAEKLGVPLSTAMQAMLRQFVRDQELVLSAKRPTTDLYTSMQELRDGKGKKFTGTTEDFIASL
ncbi:MAG: hypothetical protein WDZ56_01900 [Candidatus Paceibacterota bacterium]